MAFFLPLSAICTAVVGLWAVATRARSKLPYPPGPKGLPFIGSVLDIDSQRPHLTYTQWAKTYGDIVYTRTLGRDIIIVNSEKTARMLADGRSEIYSDRYRSPIFRIYGIDRMTALLEYGNEWKIHRKLLHLSLRNNVVDKYNDLYLNYARQLFQNILRDSSKLFEHIDLYTGSVLVELIYGQRVQGKNDPTFAMANGLVYMINKEMTADKIGLLNVMPFLQYLPSWFPGAGFKRNSGRCRKMVSDVVEVPFTMAKTEIEHGALSHCMISDILKDGGVEESLAKAAVSGLYLAGGETASARFCRLNHFDRPIDCFRVENPSVNAVVGRGTLPTIADRPRLPYLQAVLYEILRWNPPGPLGL
ncbi:cytochrome P450 [Pisolithus marmoratus]|nr:cytochrome P450 [Pisolithus marmoratus]